jgi:hypothetical protein
MPRVTPRLQQSPGAFVPVQGTQVSADKFIQDPSKQAKQVATGLSKLSSWAEKVGAEARENYNEAEALKLDNEIRETIFGTMSGEEGFLNKPGSVAISSYKQTLDSLQTDTDEILSRADNETVRRVVSRRRDQQLMRANENAASHYFAATIEAKDAQREQSIKNDINDYYAAIAAGRPDQAGAAVDSLMADIAVRGADLGQDPQTIQSAQKEARAALYKDQVTKLTNAGKLDEADKFLKDFGEDIPAKDRTELRENLKIKQQARSDGRIAQELAERQTEGTIWQQIQATTDAAEDYAAETNMTPEEETAFMGQVQQAVRVKRTLWDQRGNAMLDEASTFLQQHPNASVQEIPNYYELIRYGKGQELRAWVANRGKVTVSQPKALEHLTMLRNGHKVGGLRFEDMTESTFNLMFRGTLTPAKMEEARDAWLEANGLGDTATSGNNARNVKIDSIAVQFMTQEEWAASRLTPKQITTVEQERDKTEAILKRESIVLRIKDALREIGAMEPGLSQKEFNILLEKWQADQWVNAAGTRFVLPSQLDEGTQSTFGLDPEGTGTRYGETGGAITEDIPWTAVEEMNDLGTDFELYMTKLVAMERAHDEDGALIGPAPTKREVFERWLRMGKPESIERIDEIHRLETMRRDDRKGYEEAVSAKQKAEKSSRVEETRRGYLGEASRAGTILSGEPK